MVRFAAGLSFRLSFRHFFKAFPLILFLAAVVLLWAGNPAVGAGNPATGAGNPAVGAGNPAVGAGNPALEPGSGLKAGQGVLSAKGEFSWQVFWYYLSGWFPEGIDHILNFSAPDHLLFVLGLCLGALSLGRLFLVVSCFTLAHGTSLTIVAFSGWTMAPGVELGIELGIAATIFWIGFDYIRRHGMVSRRYGSAFFFGLIHGLGFARDMLDKFQTIKLPGEAFSSAIVGKYIAAILGFNFGVDFGQLLIAGAGFYFLGRLEVFRLGEGGRLSRAAEEDQPHFNAPIGESPPVTLARVYVNYGAAFVIAVFGAGMFFERIVRALTA